MSSFRIHRTLSTLHTIPSTEETPSKWFLIKYHLMVFQLKKNKTVITVKVKEVVSGLNASRLLIPSPVIFLLQYTVSD